MGTDIHTVTQIFNQKNQQWETMEVGFFENRNYDNFYLLGGVRANNQLYTPIAQDRGIPQDFVYKTSFDVYVPFKDKEIYFGFHSFSWLTLEDLLNYDYKQCGPNDVESELLPRLKKIAEVFDLKPNMIRFVFGFDS